MNKAKILQAPSPLVKRLGCFFDFLRMILRYTQDEWGVGYLNCTPSPQPSPRGGVC